MPTKATALGADPTAPRSHARNSKSLSALRQLLRRADGPKEPLPSPPPSASGGPLAQWLAQHDVDEDSIELPQSVIDSIGGGGCGLSSATAAAAADSSSLSSSSSSSSSLTPQAQEETTTRRSRHTRCHSYHGLRDAWTTAGGGPPARRPALTRKKSGAAPVVDEEVEADEAAEAQRAAAAVFLVVVGEEPQQPRKPTLVTATASPLLRGGGGDVFPRSRATGACWDRVGWCHSESSESSSDSESGDEEDDILMAPTPVSELAEPVGW
ncbi:hypothetical protein GGR56DRAFT_259770 [Xylariaceae sp. FL0804]|nr:hypothetical protein GGR56DRAFT_259770 [Xylariaceae sp. FL0804]